jgi:limonene-1,2-epoxide hydrolase
LITFEKKIFDFGEVGPETKNNCEFKFTNTGKGILKIKEVHSTCGCTVAELDRMEYLPGESGAIKVSYIASNKPGLAIKHIYVYIDIDNEKVPKVQLTIRANMVVKLKIEPDRLRLSFKDANVPDIKISSVNKEPFAITGFKSTNGSITAEYDPNIKATEFIIEPKVDFEKLKQYPEGSIDVNLTHSAMKYIKIPFTAAEVPAFSANPSSIVVFNAEPGKPITKEILIQSRDDKDFGIESVSSRSGAVKVLSQKKMDNRYKLEVEMTPPADTGKGVFTDVLDIVITGGEKLKINCRGFYLKGQKK